MTYHLGKRPARENAIKFRLTDFIAVSALPKAPVSFGIISDPGNLGMLGNDQYGDCVFAGADHETILWNEGVGRSVGFSDATALDDYAAVTGFDPKDPNTDQGTDMSEAAKYRRKTGIVDTAGKRHLVGAYVALPGVSPRGDNTLSFLDALADAVYSFEAVGIGIEFPSTAMDQFNNGQPWEVVPGSSIEGGHYVPVVGRKPNGNFVVVTWGQLQEVTPAFLRKYVDEAIVYLSTEFLNGAGKSREGFDLAALNKALASLGGTPIPEPTPSPSPSPAPTPLPVPPPFPIQDVLPWLNAKCFTTKGKAAQSAIRAWLAAGGH